MKLSVEAMPEDEADALSAILDRVENTGIANIEALDGFLTALAVGPEGLGPHDVINFIVPADSRATIFASMAEEQKFVELVRRHRQRISRAYSTGEVYIPLLYAGDNGVPSGNDWAWGFLRATALVAADWANAADDGNHGPPIVPIWSLAYEDHPDPAFRSNAAPFSKVERAALIAAMIAGAKRLYDHFHRGTVDGCPCGSGKLAESCCEAVTLH